MDYTNDPELNGKYLGTIIKDVAELQPVTIFQQTHHVENVLAMKLR